jgi:hypothetical protein
MNSWTFIDVEEKSFKKSKFCKIILNFTEEKKNSISCCSIFSKWIINCVLFRRLLVKLLITFLKEINDRELTAES